MTLRWLPIDCLEPHPENANRMSADRLEKLKGHIVRTGRYEPIVVRPIPVRSAAGHGTLAGRACRGSTASRTRARECGPKGSFEGTGRVRSKRQNGENSARYQILNGHHRARVLRELGHTRARCDVWDVDDDEARMLLATLNRLEGRDDPKARARLVAHLATGRSAEDLARLLPEPPDAVERLLRLAEPPPEPAPPDSLAPLPQALIFFLSEEQEAVVREALGAVAEGRAAEGAARLGRAERLERLALWYLESVGRR